MQPGWFISADMGGALPSFLCKFPANFSFFRTLMSMKAGTVALALALGMSLLANVALLARLREEPPPPAPRPPERVRPAAAAPVTEVVVVREESAPAAVAASPAAPPPARPAPVALAAVQADPQVLGVIRAQEEFGAFWKDLDRVFKARAKVEEERYAQSVIGSVLDFLNLPAGSRPAFDQALRDGSLRLADIRKEHDLAKQALPPKDKTNPAAQAAYQQQKDALDLRRDERTKAVVDGVKLHMDLKDPRHAELAGNLEKLLRNLAPRP
jgi:hypothetical protein